MLILCFVCMIHYTMELPNSNDVMQHRYRRTEYITDVAVNDSTHINVGMREPTGPNEEHRYLEIEQVRNRVEHPIISKRNHMAKDGTFALKSLQPGNAFITKEKLTVSNMMKSREREDDPIDGATTMDYSTKFLLAPIADKAEGRHLLISELMQPRDALFIAYNSPIETQRRRQKKASGIFQQSMRNKNFLTLDAMQPKGPRQRYEWPMGPRQIYEQPMGPRKVNEGDSVNGKMDDSDSNIVKESSIYHFDAMQPKGPRQRYEGDPTYWRKDSRKRGIAINNNPEGPTNTGKKEQDDLFPPKQYVGRSDMIQPKGPRQKFEGRDQQRQIDVLGPQFYKLPDDYNSELPIKNRPHVG